MEDIIDISDLMKRLSMNNVAPEELIGCAIRNLYSAENYFASKHKTTLRNNIRATIAYVKLMYDYGQQMCLARTYLLHRIKILEVREQDNQAEISILRGLTPPANGPSSSGGRLEMQDVFRDQYLQEQDKESDTELEIILDTRMINEIDQSKAALYDISRRIEDRKNVLLKLENQMDNVSSQLLSSIEQSSSSFLELERKDNSCSSRVERTQGSDTSNRPKEGDARITSPKTIYNMDNAQGHEENLPSQGVLGSPRDRHGGAPDAAGSTVLGRKSSEGTVGVASASAPADQAATAETEPLEMVACIPEDTPNVVQTETSIITAGEKRKASTSPGSEADGVAGIFTRRPIKTRVIESTESPEVQNKTYDSEHDSESVFESEMDAI